MDTNQDGPTCGEIVITRTDKRKPSFRDWIELLWEWICDFQPLWTLLGLLFLAFLCMWGSLALFGPEWTLAIPLVGQVVIGVITLLEKH